MICIHHDLTFQIFPIFEILWVGFCGFLGCFCQALDLSSLTASPDEVLGSDVKFTAAWTGQHIMYCQESQPGGWLVGWFRFVFVYFSACYKYLEIYRLHVQANKRHGM